MTLVTLSSQNQITVPAWILSELGMRQGGRFLLDNKNNQIVLEPVKGSIVDQLAGSLEHLIPKSKKGVSVETAIKLAKMAKARKVANDS